MYINHHTSTVAKHWFLGFLEFICMTWVFRFSGDCWRGGGSDSHGTSVEQWTRLGQERGMAAWFTWYGSSILFLCVSCTDGDKFEIHMYYVINCDDTQVFLSTVASHCISRFGHRSHLAAHVLAMRHWSLAFNGPKIGPDFATSPLAPSHACASWQSHFKALQLGSHDISEMYVDLEDIAVKYSSRVVYQRSMCSRF